MSDYKLIVGVDRDNTINFDDKSYFGKNDNWREELRFVPGSVEGLRKLTQQADVAVLVMTHQVGIAKGVLTRERVEEINAYMDTLLRKEGVEIDSWHYCPYASKSGVARWERKGVTGIQYNLCIEDDDPRAITMKPGDGLMREAAQKLGINYDLINKASIGDRESDALTGFSAGGIGVLVDSPALKRGDSKYDNTDSLQAMAQDPQYAGRIHVVQSLSDAADIILAHQF